MVNGGDGQEGKSKCVPPLEDYMECLHHHKEVCPFEIPRSLRRNAITGSGCLLLFLLTLHPNLRLWQQAVRTQRLQAAYRKAEAAYPRENAPKPEQVRNLGLLGKEEDTNGVLGRWKPISSNRVVYLSAILLFITRYFEHTCSIRKDYKWNCAMMINQIAIPCDSPYSVKPFILMAFLGLGRSKSTTICDKIFGVTVWCSQSH